MELAEIIQTKHGQLVRLPDSVHLKGEYARVEQQDDALILHAETIPEDTVALDEWDSIFTALGKFGAVFPMEREQLPLEERQGLFE